jgi:hypothetical protein
MMSTPTTGTAPSTSSSSSYDTAILTFPPIVHVLFGIVLEIVFVVGCIMSMQTSEAWLLSFKDASLAPNLSIFNQFPMFFSGTLGEDTTIAFVFAFTVQMILLTAKIGLATVHARIGKKHGMSTPTGAMQKSARRRTIMWNWLSGISLALNALADLYYSWHLGFLQSVAFSVAMFLATFYLGTFGIQNISAGMSNQ